MPYDETDDAFGATKTPALSWKGVPVGAVFRLEVLAPAKVLHSRDFETGQPAYWDSPINHNPKLSAVVNVCVLAGPHSVGEERSVWAQRPSALYAAVAQAQKEANAKLAPGGILSLKFSGEIPHENKRYSPIKQYLARYEPPADAFVTPPQGQARATPLASAPEPLRTSPPVGWPAQPTRPDTHPDTHVPF